MSNFKMQEENESPKDTEAPTLFFANSILMISDLAFKIDKEGCESDETSIPRWIVDNLVKK